MLFLPNKELIGVASLTPSSKKNSFELCYSNGAHNWYANVLFIDREGMYNYCSWLRRRIENNKLGDWN